MAYSDSELIEKGCGFLIHSIRTVYNKSFEKTRVRRGTDQSPHVFVLQQSSERMH